MTSLSGTLTVYYPGGDKYDTYWSNGDVKIPASQTGEFAYANVCSGSVNEDGTNLTLYNKTAIIKVIVPADTKKLTLTSLNPIDDSGQRGENGAVAIADGSATTITVGNGSSNIPNPCYVSILAGNVLLQDLNIDVDDKAQGGFSPNAIVAKGKTPSEYAVEVNTIYTLSESSLHEYVTVGSQKWATMNVGATEANPYGYYFAWGDTEGHVANVSEKTFDYSFSWSNAPFNGGESSYSETEFNKVKDTVCPGGTLALAYDAANVNWGGAWRMPTREEFIDFLGGKESIYIDYDVDFSKNGITFPSAGYGGSAKYPDALCEFGEAGYFWTSTFNADNPNGAFVLHSEISIMGEAHIMATERSRSRSVRPVSE